MKRIILALCLLLLPSLASAQCNGVFPNNYACGNTSGAPDTPGPVAISTFSTVMSVGVTTISGGTNGYYLYNNNGVLGNIIPPTIPAAAPWYNTRLAKTANYTALSADCGDTLALGGSTQFTLTLNAASGYVANCVFVIINEDTTRGKILAINGVTQQILWPSTATVTSQVTVINQNNVWKVSPQPRWQVTNQTIYVDNGAGADSNDCLASGAGACATSAQAMTIVAQYLDNQGSVTIQWGCAAPPCTYANVPFTAKSYVGSGTVALLGNSGTPDNIVMSCNSACGPALFLFNGTVGKWYIHGFKTDVTGTTGIYHIFGNGSGQVITYGSMDFVRAPGAAHLGCAIQCRLENDAGYTISGSASYHMDCEDGSVCHITSGTINLVAGAFTAFLNAHGAGAIIGTDATHFGGAGVTGPQWVCTLMALIDTAGTSASLPGNSTGNIPAGTMPTTGGAAGCFIL